ncbi:MAG: NAD(P)/FAD-dependent oxidoreductase [Inquilinaceae bacterium]
MNEPLAGAGSAFKVAVIGAGLAGLTCATRLAEEGIRVTVFDKGREPGGRMATRRTGSLRFDHGAQYFTVTSPVFAKAVRHWTSLGVVATWAGPVLSIADGQASKAAPRQRLTALPSMNAVARHLAGSLDVHCGTRIETIDRGVEGWRVHAENATEPMIFDGVAVAVPAPQAIPFLTASPAMADATGTVRMASCWTVMAAFPTALAADFAGAFIEGGGPLSWVARNGSKPGRTNEECWVLHADATWSAAHLEEPAERVAALLLAAFWRSTGLKPAQPSHLTAHRWRFARAVRPLDTGFLFDRDLGLGACGDWCLGDRVESAYLSGVALAERFLARS